MKIRRICAILLTLCMLFSFTSCGKSGDEQELGNINPAEVTEDLEKPQEADGPFNQLDSKYYKDWQTINSGLSGMSFSVPASWEVKTVNARHYKISVPESDKALPGATFNVVYVYNYYLEATQNVEDFDAAFADDTSGITYDIDGKQYSEVYKDAVVTGKYSDSSFSDGSLISCNIIEKVHLQDKLGYQPKGTYNAYHYSIKWNDVAMQIRTVAKPEDEKTVKRIFSEIASSIKPYKYPVNSTIEAEFNSSTVMIPKEFTKTKQNGVTVYKASEMADTPFAGVRIAELKVDCDLKNFDKVKFAEEEIMDAVDFFMPSNLYTASCEKYIDDPYQMNIRGEDITFVYANIQYNAKDDKGGSFFGNRNNMLMVMYILPSSTNEHKAICTLMLEMQSEAMSTILDCMNKTIIMK